jgi:hypothetical protein
MPYCGMKVDGWVTTDFGLRMFSTDRTKAISAYREFVDCDADEVPSPFDEIRPDRPHILGNDEFAARVSQQPPPLRSTRTLESLIAEGCNRHGVHPEDLESGRRSTQIARARTWIAKRAIELGLATVSKLAHFLHCDPKSIRNALRRRDI